MSTVIHELREYAIAPAHWPAFRTLFETLGLPLRRNDYGVLLGSWLGEADGQVRFLHLWRYDALDARAALRVQMAAVPDWTARYLPQAAALVQTQTLSVLRPQGAPVLPTLAAAGGVAYLHRYRCAVGQAGALVPPLRDAAPDRLGLWTTEFPHPNDVALLTPCATPPLGDRAVAVQSQRLVDLGHAGALSST